MNKKLILTVLFTFILVGATFNHHALAASPKDTTFSIMQIGDTQFLAKSYPQLFLDTTNWIANNAEDYNVKMVIHTGDIVDNIGTNARPDLASSDPTQWNIANEAMSTCYPQKSPIAGMLEITIKSRGMTPTGTGLAVAIKRSMLQTCKPNHIGLVTLVTQRTQR